MLLDIFNVIHHFNQAESPHFAEQSIFCLSSSIKKAPTENTSSAGWIITSQIPISLSPITKYSNNLHKYFPYITQIFSMLLGLHKYSIHKPINCLGPSHRYYPLYPTKNTHNVIAKIGPQNYTISIKSPKSFYLWAKPKRAQQYHLLSPLLHGTYKARYDLAPLKPVAIRHL